MVITDRFIYIHQPKTGGTFVTDALLKLYGVQWGWWPHLKTALRGWTEWDSKFGLLRMQDKHGSCSRIPRKFADRPIFSTIRNPFDYYVSQYEFGWWKRKEWMKYYRQAEGAEELLHGFPDLSFEHYLKLMVRTFNKANNQDFEDPDQLGFYTTSFIRLFFRDTGADEKQNSDAYFQEEAFREDMYDVSFLTTRNLNSQLYQYLNNIGFAEEQISFILNKKKVLPQGKGRTERQAWQQYYNPELKALIAQKDALIFKLVPDYMAALNS